MVYADYETKLKSATGDNFQTVILEALDDIKTDLAERDALSESIASKDAKIAELQDTNMKLFLSIGKAGGEEVDPESEEETLIKEVEDEIEKILIEEE